MDIYKKLAPSIVIGSLVAMVGYYGYYGFKKYQKIYHYLNQVKVNDDTNTVTVEDAHLVINYVYLNDRYTLRVPYDEDMVATMTQYEVYGIRKNGDEVKLTQQPGVAYLVKPREMGYDHITVYDLGEEEERHYYDIPPFYGNVPE